MKTHLANLLLSVASLPPLGSRFAAALKEMRKAQWYGTEELLVRNEARLGVLLLHAATNVPFYSAFCQRNRIKPDELRTISDLQTLPVCRKADYRAREPSQFFATNIAPSFRIDRKTSGSTGEPFKFSLDRRAITTIFASHIFYDSWHGLQPFDRYLRIAAPPASTTPLPENSPVSVRLQQSITTRLQTLYENWTQEKISLWEVDSTRSENIWRRIEAFQPKFVMGYSSTLAAIADELLRRDLRLTTSLKGVITIAETLTPNRRKLIETYFAAPIINRYGLREFGSWSAQSCKVSPDHFHINTELVVCEILRPDGTQCAAGETGRVVMTDLHNFARPFIRYDTGDLATVAPGSCLCGRGFPLMGQIQGRSLECLRTPSGKEISPAILGHFLFVYHDHLEAVRHYQLVQESAHRVNLLIVPGEAWNEQRRTSLRSDLMQFLGQEFEVDIQTVVEIAPEKSGKRPIIKLAPDSSIRQLG